MPEQATAILPVWDLKADGPRASFAIEPAADKSSSECDEGDAVLCLQNVSGGQPVPVEGTALPLWGLEIDPDRATDEFRAFNARDDGKVGRKA